MSIIDLSKSVEQLEAMEDKLGIRISGIYVTVSKKPVFDDEYKVEAGFEVFLERGKKLQTI